MFKMGRRAATEQSAELADFFREEAVSRGRPSAEVPAGDHEDRLVDIASMLEPDGGMPGEDLERRLLLTALTILAFASAGHTDKTGPFRRHVKRMLKFLKDELPGPLAPDARTVVERVLQKIVAPETLDDTVIDMVSAAARDSSLSAAGMLRHLRSCTA